METCECELNEMQDIFNEFNEGKKTNQVLGMRRCGELSASSWDY